MAVQDVEYRQADTQSSFLGALGMLSSSHSSVDFAGKVDLTGQAHSSPCRITHCLSVPEITDVAVHDVLGTIISSWTPNRLSRTLLEQVPLPRLTPTQPSVFSLATHVLKAQLVNLTSRLRSLEAENSSLNKDNTTIMAENSNLRCTNTILVSDLSTLNGELTKLRENNEKAIQTDKFKEDEANLQEDAWLDRKNSEPSPPMSEADLTLVDRSFATHDFEFLEDATTNLTKNFETKESHQDEQHRNVLNLASISTSPSTVMSSSTSTNTKTNTAAKEPLINVRINRPRSRTYPIPTLRRIATKTQQQPIRIPSAVKEIHKRKASSSRKLTTSHIRSSTLSPSDSASPSTSTSMVSSFSVSLNSGFSFKDQDKDRIHTDAKSRATMKTMKLKSKSSEDQAPGSENEKGVSTPPSSPTPHLRISPTLGTPGSHRTSPGSGSDSVKPLSLKPQKLNVPSPTRVARATVPASPIPRPPRSPHRPVSTLRIPLRSPARRRSRSTSRTRNANTSSTTNTPAKKRPALQALDVNASKPRVANGSKTMPPKVKPLRPKRSAKDLGKRRGVILTERLQGLASPTKDADGTKTSPHPLKDVAPAKRQDSCQTALASTNSVSTDSLQTELASVDSMCSVVRTDGHSSEDAYSDLDGDRKVKDAQLNVKRHDKPDSDKQQDNNPKDMATDNAASAKLCSSVLASLERICAAFSGSDLGSLEMTISEEGEGVVEEDVFESAVVGGGGAKKTGEEQSQTVTKERQVAVAAESAGAGVDEDSEDQEGDETLRIAASDLSRTVGLSRSLSLLPQIRRALMLESECGDSEEEDLDLDLDTQLKSTTKQDDTTEGFFADSARASAFRPSTPATKLKSRISVRSMIWSASAVSGSTPRRAPDLSPAKLLAYDKPGPSILSSSSSSSTSLASQSSSSDASVGSPTTFSPRARKLSRSKLQLPPMVLGSTAPRVGHVACASPPRPSNQTEPVERPKIGGSRSGVSLGSKDPASSAIARSPRSPPRSSSGKLKTVPSPSKAQIKTSPKKTAMQRSPPRKSAIAAPRPVIFPVRKPQNPAKTGTEPRVSIGRNLLRHLPIGASTKITKPASKPPIAPAPAASAAQKSFLAPPTALLAPPSPETQIRSQTQAQTKPRSHTVNTISPLSPALSTPSQQALDDAAAAKKPRSNTVNTYSPVRSSPLAQSVVNAVRASRDSMSMRMRGKPGGTGGDGVGRTPGGQVPPVVSPTTLTVPSANTSPSAAPTTKGGTAPLRIAKKTAVAHAKPSTPAPPPASPQMSTASTTKRLQPPATSPNKVHLHPDDEAPPTAAFMRPKASAPSKDNIRTKRMTNSIAPLIPNWSPGAAPARCKGIFRNSLSMVR